MVRRCDSVLMDVQGGHYSPNQATDQSLPLASNPLRALSAPTNGIPGPSLVRTFSPEMIWPVWVRPNCQPTPVYAALPGLDGKQQLALRRVVEAVLPTFRQRGVGLLVDFEILVLHYVPVVGVLLAIETGHAQTLLVFPAG